MDATARKQLDTIVEAFGADARGRLEKWLDARSAVEFRAMELEVAALGREVADKVVEVVLRTIVSDREFQAQTAEAARAGAEGGLRDVDRRSVEVTLLGGSKVRVRVPYFRPKKNKKKTGRKRGTGRRGPGGAGLFPPLAALGICFGVTPALAGEIVRQVADSDSVRSGRAALARRGIDLGHKQTLRIVNGFGGRAIEQRDVWLAGALEQSPKSGPLRGKRVVVAADGGRIRERVALPGRPREETGHHRYEAPWREPKLFTIYIVDSQGAIVDTFRPIYDGTLENCDGAFARLAGYLKALGAHQARALALLGDGARWIWERADQLVEALGIPRNRVVQIVDWYHAVEVLGEVADAPARWSKDERERWLKQAKQALYAGRTKKLMELFDEVALGRRARAVNEHRQYFVKNADRMRYADFAAKKLPIGSGAVESAIRRVVNMRMKGTGTFWRHENAESMILLRCYLKTDRFDDLVDWSISTAAGWWKRPGLAVPTTPIKEVA